MASVVANTIAEQIGHKAFVMMGTNGHIIGSDNGLSFKIAGCPLYNYVEIVLNHRDLYDVNFIKIRKFQRVKVQPVNNVCADQLHEVIQSNTGLYLSI